MLGCGYNAKNTLVKNYLYLAEHAGAVVHADTTVTSVRPRTGGGYEVTTERSRAWLRKRKQTLETASDRPSPALREWPAPNP
jgi:cholesterol oxidase